MYLNILPKSIKGIRNKNINTDDIPVDMNIAEILRQI